MLESGQTAFFYMVLKGETVSASLRQVGGRDSIATSASTGKEACMTVNTEIVNITLLPHGYLILCV